MLDGFSHAAGHGKDREDPGGQELQNQTSRGGIDVHDLAPEQLQEGETDSKR